VLQANVARIRQAARNAFKFNPREQAQRQAIAEEGANVWVVSSTGETDRATSLADYLSYQGFAASAPRGQSPAKASQPTIITAYNGAETSFPKSAARLAALFKVEIVAAADPKARADFVVTQGARTPRLKVPTGP
jgi:hypothetical protein